MVESYLVPQNTMSFWKLDEGEKQIDFCNVDAVNLNNNEKFCGELMVTRYKLVFRPYGDDDDDDNNNPFNDFPSDVNQGDVNHSNLKYKYKADAETIEKEKDERQSQ